MSKRVLQSMYPFFRYLVAGVILVAVLTATVMRLALTEIDAYRDEIRTWISEYMEYPIRFSEIDMEWRGWTPYFSLSDIQLLTRDGQSTLSHFDTVRVRIAPVQSLLTRQWIPKQLIISGLQLDLIRTQDGSLVILGEETRNTDGQDLAVSELPAWLLHQTNIRLQNARINWIDRKADNAAVQFNDVALSIRTHNARTQIDATAKLPERDGAVVELKLDLNGDPLTSDWSGRIYLAASNAALEQFLPVSGLNLEQTGSRIQLWTDWQQAELTGLQSRIAYQNLTVTTDSATLSIPKLNAAVAANRVNRRDWSIQIQLEELLTENGAWPDAAYAIQLRRNQSTSRYGYAAWFDYLNTADAAVLLRAFTAADRFPAALLNRYGIRGELHDVTLSHAPDAETSERFKYAAQFSGLAITERATSTSLADLAGELAGNTEQLSIRLDSEFATLTAPAHLNRSIEFPSIVGNLHWNKHDSVHKLAIPLLTVTAPDFPLSISGKVQFPPNQASPLVEMIAFAGDAALEKIPDYLPASTPGGLKTWLSRTLVAGDVTYANLLFRGRFADYPFTQAEGVFKAVFDVENVTLDYHQDWPPIDNLNAEVILDGSRLDVKVSDGKIYDAAIQQAQITIEDFRQNTPRVRLEGEIAGMINHIRLFIEQSPLAAKLALNDIANWNLSGAMKLALALDIPIGGGVATVNGNLNWVDGSLASKRTGFSLEKINGAIHFTENSITATNMNALYSLHPVAVGLSGQYGRPFEFMLAGKADRAFLIRQIEAYYPGLRPALPDLRNAIRGECNWTLKMHKNDTGIVASLESDMYGLGLDLPAPLGKTEAESRPTLLATSRSAAGMDTVRIEYDTLLQAELAFDTADSVRSAPAAGQPRRRKVQIKGQIETLEAAGWPQFRSVATGLREYEAEINIAKLVVLANEFNDIGLTIAPVAGGYKTTLSGSAIQGEIVLPDSLLTQPVIANIQHLRLNRHAASAGEKEIAPESLPAFEIKIDRLIYGDLDLGELTLVTRKIEKGLKVETISFSKPGININGAGTWHKDADTDVSLSVFNFDLYAESMAAILNGYGYSGSHIEGGETFINLEANWNGSPADFSFKKLDGAMNVDMGQGKFLNINPVIVRVLGLFNLQTLYRRLTLDFSNLFGTGLDFDNITGNFDLEHGNAYTNNLRMQGPTAEIRVTGRTGLLARDYDQSVLITPQISNNLPIANTLSIVGAFLGPAGAGVGVAIFLADKLFEGIPEQVNKLWRYRYTITGNWDDPVIERVGEPKTIQ